jgi:release factor glutamine methyltransferase
MGRLVLTIRNLLKRTESYLGKRELPSPRVDAEVMLADLLGMKRIELYMHADRPIDDAELDEYRERVERRGAHEPVAYICGSCGFWTLDLKIDERALVPRPETELIVELVKLMTSGEPQREWRIVDVGTGSGAIALALASELEAATILAIDRSSDALELARENAEMVGLRDRVRFVQGDLLQPLLSASGKTVDIVVSNPPYVAENDETGVGVLEFEPKEALLAGADGLDVIRRLIPQAAQVLEEDGGFFCEIGASQGEAVAQLAGEYFGDTHIIKDYSKLDRVLAAGEPKK